MWKWYPHIRASIYLKIKLWSEAYNKQPYIHHIGHIDCKCYLWVRIYFPSKLIMKLYEVIVIFYCIVLIWRECLRISLLFCTFCKYLEFDELILSIFVLLTWMHSNTISISATLIYTMALGNFYHVYQLRILVSCCALICLCKAGILLLDIQFKINSNVSRLLWRLFYYVNCSN